MNLVKKLVDTLTYSAGNDVSVDLPTDGFITQIDLEEYITASGSGAAALSTYGLWRFLQNIKVEGGGGRNYFGMSGTQMGILLHFLNLKDHPGRTWREIVATSQYAAHRLHFGSYPLNAFGHDNPFDLSVAIPGVKETNLKLTLTFAASDDTIDDTLTISSGTVRVTVYEAIPGTPSEAAMLLSKLWVPISSTEGYDPGATKSDLEGERDVPTGACLRRIAVMALDATAGSSNGPLLKDDQATEIGLKLVKNNVRLFHMRTKAMELQNPLFDGMQVVDTPNTLSPFSTPGLYLVDLRTFDHPERGLDTRGMSRGDVKLGFTIGAYSSGEKEFIWYDQVMRNSLS